MLLSRFTLYWGAAGRLPEPFEVPNLRHEHAEASMLFPWRRSIGRWVRLSMLVVALLTLLSSDLTRATMTFAKNIDIIGTVDCGLPSGKRCSINDTLVLLTDNLTGAPTLATIDVSWIKDKLPALIKTTRSRCPSRRIRTASCRR